MSGAAVGPEPLSKVKVLVVAGGLRRHSFMNTDSATGRLIAGQQPVRVLVVAHSAVLYSGVAEVVRLVFSALADQYGDKYRIEQVGLLHLSAVTSPPWPITPTQTRETQQGRTELDPADLNGELTVPRVLARFDPDIVFCHNDPHAVLYLLRLRAEKACRWKLVLYINFDGVPVPPGFQCLLGADQLVTLSEFSRNAYLNSISAEARAKAAVDVLYCPADTRRFNAIENAPVARWDNRPGWMPPGAFVIGWVGRNQWRKQPWIAYELIARLRYGRYRYCIHCGKVACRAATQGGGQSRTCFGCQFADASQMPNVFLWMHLPTGKEPGPWHLEELERTYGVLPGRDLHYTDGCTARDHLVPDAMPVLYRCFDVLLLLSGGEGFGLPAWEAMASEVPVVYTDYSSHAEFIGRANGGVAVGGVLQPEPVTGILRMIPDIEDCIGAVRRMILDPDCAIALGKNGRRFAQCFNKDVLAKEWDERFTRLLQG